MLRLFALTIALALTGCVLFKQPVREASASVSLPEVWESAGKGNEGKISTGWAKTFGDRTMIELIEEALENNQNLQAASARLRQAKEGTILGRAARFPSIGIGGRGSSTRRVEQIVPATPAPAPAPAPAPTTVTTTAPDGTVTTTSTAPAPAAPAPTPDPVPTVVYSSDYGLSLDASWEMDLWGRLRDLDHAAYEDFVAAKADFRAARLSLAANTAKAYLDLITAQQRFDLAVKTRDSFLRNRRIIEGNYIAGDETASPLDVQFARNNVASAERSMVGSELARDEAARVLEGLLGRYPRADVRAGAKLPTIRQSIPAGLPSGLLMRRPDLVAAAAAVRSSANRADASRKDLLPSFRLTAGGATTTEELGRMLIDPEQIVWNAASSLAQTVYQGGALRASARQALARNEEQIRNFASQVLVALREVESALATERSLIRQEAFLEVELRQANLAEDQAYREYTDGLVGILEILEAQRRAVAARNSMITLRNQRLQNRVDLHLALGGDFKTAADAD